MQTYPILTTIEPVIGPPQGKWTHDEWEKLPDDGNRYEIINGVLYMSTAPSLFHQRIILAFYDLFSTPIKTQGLGYLMLAPIGLFMPRCDPVQPDFVLILKTNLVVIYDKHIEGVPDLIMEVISPGSATYDEDTKLHAYERAGVPEYVVIDPKARVLRYYLLNDGAYSTPQAFKEGESVSFACAPEIAVPISELFVGSPSTTL